MCQQINEHTKLEEIDLPSKWMIFEQAFSVLCWQSGFLKEASRPQSVADLAENAGMSSEQVCATITELKRTLNEIIIAKEEREQLEKQGDYLRIDLEVDAASTQRKAFSVAEIWTMEDPELLRRPVLISSRSFDRALSAALAMRQRGWLRVYVMNSLYS